MPQMLKGKTKYKIPADAKPGDEVELEATFEADQDDYERALTKRLSQQEKKHDAKVAELEKQVEDAKGTTPPRTPAPAEDPKLKKLAEDLAATQQKLAERDLRDRITAALNAQGLDKAPKVYRESIRLKADATDEEIDAAVAGLKADPDLAKFLGTEPEAGAGGNGTQAAKVGQRGTGGSGDQRADQKLADLKAKMERNAPNLKTMFSQISDPAEQMDILSSWDKQGSLEAKTAKA